MRIYYQDNFVTLYCADNRQVMPILGEFDLLLTDPPYGIGEGNRKRILSRGKRRSGDKQLTPARDYGECNWDKDPAPKWVLDQAMSHSKLSVIWGGNYFDLPPVRSWLVWDKENGASDFADCELAWTNLPQAVRIFRFRWAGMLQGNMRDKEERSHPTQKPVPLMEWCLSHVPSAQTILDPWAGSGTTLLAAKLLGRRAVGIEIDERYCKAAGKRLQQEVLPLGDTSQADPRQTQPELVKL